MYRLFDVEIALSCIVLIVLNDEEVHRLKLRERQGHLHVHFDSID
jgi:hypothetical protein